MAVDYFLLYLSDDNFQTFIEKGKIITSPYSQTGLQTETNYQVKLKAVKDGKDINLKSILIYIIHI